jgi:hypothetical protein
MQLTNKAAFMDALQLGLVISVRLDTLDGVEMSRGYGAGTPNSREPDLVVCRTDDQHVEVEATSEEGEIFLGLIREEDDIPDCMCCCCTGECREYETLDLQEVG